MEATWLRGAMRLLPLLLIVPALAGCLDPVPSDPAPSEQDPMVGIMHIAYPGSDVAFAGKDHGVLAVVSNHGPTSEAMACIIGMDDPQIFGPTGWASTNLVLGGAWCADRFTLEAGGNATVGAIGDVTGNVSWVLRLNGVTTQYPVDVSLSTDDPLAVGPGDHVQTITAGFWINGTSFYTNIKALNDDPDFPAGYDRSGFGGDRLPIYVYGDDRSEQPPRSKDTCHFTTITGYNRMLQDQFEGQTAVTFMAPEDGYTRPGNEEHTLYGDPLIFINTVVVHDGATDTRDQVGDPQGACFDAENTSGGVGP